MHLIYNIVMKDSRTRMIVLDQANIGTDLDYGGLKDLGDLGLQSLVADENLAAFVRTAQVPILIANRPLFPKPVLEACKESGVKLICLTATGTNTVNLDAARELGIAVCNIVGYSTEAVTQHTFALVFALLNHCATFHQWAVGKTWLGKYGWTDLSRPIHELSGQRWGVIGLGAIGRRVASMAEAFGCDVYWSSVSGKAREEQFPRLGLDELLATCDIVSIHAPLNDDSRGLLNYRRMSAMKKNALLVNVGRGGIIVEEDLARILQEGKITGAGLDVLWPEPPRSDNPLLDPALGERLVLTPHVAWAAVEARQRALAETKLNIQSWLEGGRRNRVD